VHEDATGKIALDAQDLGEQSLKNIARPVPIGSRWVMRPAQRPRCPCPTSPQLPCCRSRI
jgi:hypothetical protein